MAATPSEKPAPPDAAALAELLGPAGALWTQLTDAIRTNHTPVTERWVYGGRKYGWSCRLERRKKGIVYLMPDAGHIRVGLALSDAARDVVLAGNLPATIREPLATATKAIEGWPVRMIVRTPTDVEVALKLASIKASN